MARHVNLVSNIYSKLPSPLFTILAVLPLKYVSLPSEADVPNDLEDKGMRSTLKTLSSHCGFDGVLNIHTQ